MSSPETLGLLNREVASRLGYLLPLIIHCSTSDFGLFLGLFLVVHVPGQGELQEQIARGQLGLTKVQTNNRKKKSDSKGWQWVSSQRASLPRPGGRRVWAGEGTSRAFGRGGGTGCARRASRVSPDSPARPSSSYLASSSSAGNHRAGAGAAVGGGVGRGGIQENFTPQHWLLCHMGLY